MSKFMRNQTVDLLQNPVEYDESHTEATARIFAEKIKEISKMEDARVLILGDYDVDGICSTYIMEEILKANGIECKSYLPSRETDGYGISDKVMLSVGGFDTVICVDNGLNENDKIKQMQDMGIEVMVIDHHEHAQPCMADMILEPSEDATQYSATGLCYKVAMESMEYMKSTEQVPDKMAELIAIQNKMKVAATIGTVGDMVPILGDNRKILEEGLKEINENGAIDHMLESVVYEYKDGADLEENPVTTEKIAFNIAPPLNAYGRVHDEGATNALSALKRTLENNPDSNYEGMKNVNRMRKEQVNLLYRGLDVKTNNKYVPQIAVSNPVHKLSKEGMQLNSLIQPRNGYNGLLAQKLAQQTGLPSIVMRDAGNGTYVGSGRSVGNYDLNAFVELNNDIIKGGGHAEAIGLTVKAEDLEELVSRTELLEELEADRQAMHYDFMIHRNEVNTWNRLQNEDAIFGQGHQKPTFALSFSLNSVNALYANDYFTKMTMQDGLEIVCFDKDVCNAIKQYATGNNLKNHIGHSFTVVGTVNKDQFIVNDVEIYPYAKKEDIEQMPKSAYGEMDEHYRHSDLEYVLEQTGKNMDDVTLKDVKTTMQNLEMVKGIQKARIENEEGKPLKEKLTEAETEYFVIHMLGDEHDWEELTGQKITKEDFMIDKVRKEFLLNKSETNNTDIIFQMGKNDSIPTAAEEEKIMSVLASIQASVERLSGVVKDLSGKMDKIELQMESTNRTADTVCIDVKSLKTEMAEVGDKVGAIAEFLDSTDMIPNPSKEEREL